MRPVLSLRVVFSGRSPKCPAQIEGADKESVSGTADHPAIIRNLLSSTITKITRNYQVTIPPAARQALNLKVGDFVEASARRDGVLLRPARVVTDDIFEQELRRRLEEGIADLEAGRTSGPFETADDLIAQLHQIARPSRPRPRRAPPRR